MNSRNVVNAALTIIAVSLVLSSFPKVRAQKGGTKDNKTIDLSGTWKTDDGKEVVIEQSGQTVKATFLSGGDCPWGGARDFYLQGSLSGNSLTGTMKRCTRSRQLLQDCHLTDPYSAKIIETTVDQNTITGKYVPDYITYDEKNGHYVNCGIKPGGGTPTGFTLKRECRDKDAPRIEGCANLQKAIKDFMYFEKLLNLPYREHSGEVRARPDFVHLTKSDLKKLDEFKALMNKVRDDFCDNPKVNSPSNTPYGTDIRWHMEGGVLDVIDEIDSYIDAMKRRDPPPDFKYYTGNYQVDDVFTIQHDLEVIENTCK